MEWGRCSYLFGTLVVAGAQGLLGLLVGCGQLPAERAIDRSAVTLISLTHVLLVMS